MKISILKSLQKTRMQGKPVATLTNFKTGSVDVVEPDTLPGTLPDEVILFVRNAFAADRSHRSGDWFINIYPAPLQLFIIGAVHIAKPLIRIAELIGYKTTIIDPRDGFSQSQSFSQTHMISSWPDEALEALAITRRTAIVTLTHDPKLDDAALRVALHSPAFYIGALGSKKTQAARVERLTSSGFSADQINRIKGPVGLDIGAANPEEIAVSILAQMIQTLRTETQQTE